MSKKKMIHVFLAMALAVVAGHYSGKTAAIFGVPLYDIYSLIGQLFLNALTLVVVPLVAASIITGTARMGGEQSFGRLGIKTFGIFLGTTGIAIGIGWVLAIIFQPGTVQTISIEVSAKVLEIASQANQGAFAKIEQLFLKLIPSNILAVASQGQMIGLFFFSLFFGLLLNKIESEPSHVLMNFWKGIFQVMIKMTELVMKAMPIGVFGLVAKVVAMTGIESIYSVGYFFIVVLIGLVIYMFGALGILLRFVAKVNPIAHLRAMGPALLTAFSTSSSIASLPIVIDCIEKKSGVSNRLAGFTLPLGTSLNLAGSSLQVIISVFFIAQAYGIAFSFSTQLLIFMMTWLLSMGVTGIPSASLISIVIILTSLGFPADGIGLVMAVERLLDMCRTTVNVYSNSCSAVLIARSEGEQLCVGIMQR